MGSKNYDVASQGCHSDESYAVTTEQHASLIEELVAYGVDDWVHEAEVCGNIARRVTEDPDDRRAVAVGLIAHALHAGLMVAGTVPRGVNGFTAWDLDASESLAAIAVSWFAKSDPDVLPGEIVWLCNTAKGEALGNAALARMNSER